MNVIFGLENISGLKDVVCTVGTFDGIHLGHIEILNRLNEIGDDEQLNSCLVTFDPHPKSILQNPGFNKIQYITTLEEKLELLQKVEIKNVVIIKFTREFSVLDYRQFVTDILINKIGMRYMVVGYDHAFGKDRKGSFEDLLKISKDFNFGIEKVPPLSVQDITVSSTKIRQLLTDGDVVTTASLLGRYHSVTGIVVRGDGRGRHLRFPTANLQIGNSNKLLPKEGVYVVECDVCGENFRGMANIGFKPTFGGVKKTLEIHLLDFNHDIYGEKLTVNFLKRLREERKFENREELIKQLEIDKKQSLKN